MFTLGFVSVLVGIGVLPAAYADSMHVPCTTGKFTAPGGEAEWLMCTKDGHTEIQGRVTDTAVDNKCVQVVIDFTNDVRKQSDLACDGSSPIQFLFREPADGAEVAVRVKTR